MQERIAFVVEKPSVARALAPHLSARWPHHQILAITTLYTGLYDFRYPRGLSIADFPFVSDPKWKRAPIELGPAVSPVWSISGGTIARSGLRVGEALAGAGVIWCAVDPDASGAIAYHVLLSECLGPSLAAVARPALRLFALDTASVDKALDAGTTTADAWFVECLNAGVARRFFDFNFNVNALALLGAALRRTGVVGEGYAMSKYSLQLLYELRERPAMKEAQVMQLMVNWRGSGRYAPSPLGSPASRAAIIEGLQRAGLVVADSERHIVLAEPGQAFLRLLHPDCRDADLPARMRQWEAGWPASRPNVERYLRTFFGKQKRFASAELAKG